MERHEFVLVGQVPEIAVMCTGIPGFHKAVPRVVREDVVGDEAIVGPVSLGLVPGTDDQAGRAVVEDRIARNHNVGCGMPQVNAISTIVVHEVVENMAAPVGMVDGVHLAARGGTLRSVCPPDIVESIANRVIVGTGVVAVKDPRATVVAEGGSRSSDIVHMIGNESDVRTVVVKAGSPDTTYIETNNIHVIAPVVPGAAIDDVPDDVGFPFLFRNVSDARIRNS